MKKLKQLGAVLSKDQQRRIIGGYGSCGSGPCGVYNSADGSTHYGTCGWVENGTGVQVCECDTDLGFYWGTHISVCYTV